MKYTVRKVNSLRTPEQRATVCYMGRQFAGWPGSPFGNYQHLSCPDVFRKWLLSWYDLDGHLDLLRDASENGKLPLGCYCVDWDGIGITPACHAAVYAEIMNTIER